jgi:hypothetical protein
MRRTRSMKAALGQAQWRKSSYSGGAQNCVEVADSLEGPVAVRDSRDQDGAVLVLPPAAWHVLAHRIKNGEFA